MNDNTRSYQLKKTNKPKTIDKVIKNKNISTKLIWGKPNSWVPSEGSSMRLASFAIPYSGGTGDLSVIQLGGDGGGLKSNVNRWRGQLNLEPISLMEIENIITIFKSSRLRDPTNKEIMDELDNTVSNEVINITKHNLNNNLEDENI